MSNPSNWPLSESALRVTIPVDLISTLQSHPLTESVYITAIGYYPNARMHEMKRREHDDFILMYCAEGKGSVELQSQAQSVGAGDVFILPPKQAHAYQADADKPWTLYWCHFQGHNADAFFDYIYQNSAQALVEHIGDLDFLYWFKELMVVAREAQSLENLIHGSNLLRQLLTRIERHKRRQHQSQHRQKHDISLSIPKVQAFMQGHLNKPLTLEHLAKLCGCSKFHFSRQYHEITGKSPLKHFNEMKMEHACFLLEQTTFRVSEIADQLGYDDALYFSRVFRKVYGQAPSMYRKSLLVSS